MPRAATPSSLSFIESLESRRLFSTAVLCGGTLCIRGECAGPNDILVTLNAGMNTVDVVLNGTNKKGVSATLTKSFDATKIKRVMVEGGRFDDTISVGRLDPNWTLPVTVEAGAGDDHIDTGNGDDRIDAGAGDDEITAGDGNNWVMAGRGDDTITTGAGKDRVQGGDGVDVISTGDGDDFIRAGAGDDRVFAGNGNDIVHGQLGNDLIHGGAGDDILWGGQGDDVIYGEEGNDKLGGVLGYNTLIGGAGQDQFVLVDLDTNSHDYNPAEDLLTLVKPKDDGDTLAGL